MNIIQANASHSQAIALLVMQAMTEECCLNLAGSGKTIDDFAKVMRRLTSMDVSQYSYRNAFVAVTDQGEVAGACVSYPGADLHRLREAFIREAKASFGIDHSGMPDETEPGELYIDSLAVFPEHQHKGIATALLRATIHKAAQLNMPAGLLVDKGNPRAERLYTSLGFRFVNDSTWAGHEMKHLQKPIG